jgi:hypothetical protein
VVCNQSNTYEAMEIVFKINLIPNNGEIYTLFDLAGASSINLKYSDQGLVKNGTYDLYLDGELVSNISNIDIFSGEIYHAIAVFPSSLSSDIHIGSNKNVQEKFDGTIGKLNIYSVAPSDMPAFAEEKYLDLIGKNIKNITGGTASINDSSVTQEYVRDEFGEYYEMINLPKVKIVSEL